MKIKNKPCTGALPPLLLSLILTGCGDNNSPTTASPPTPTPEEPAQLITFDDDNQLQANIKWTNYGVPHITADNLESLGFGAGFAYAKDNLCVLADQIVRVTSRRSKYFGPHADPAQQDYAHLISDFGFKALALEADVDVNYDTIGENARAMVQGYVAGYNKYLAQTGIDNLSAECAGQPWVQPITDKQLFSYITSVGLLTSGASVQFMQMAFFAAPDDNYLPYPSTSTNQKSVDLLGKPNPSIENVNLANLDFDQLGSNAWAIGSERSENGRGGLIANPHFPHFGHLRFWQSQLTIPGVMNVNGGSLQGFPAINIGFNDTIAWTHTVTEARHMALYRLTMDPQNPLDYIVDGQPKTLEKKTYEVDVLVAPDTVVTYSKDYYYSNQGLMLEIPGADAPYNWTAEGALTFKDANKANLEMLDHWIAMNLARDLNEFKQTFIDHDGIPFTNTYYADKDGKTFFIDDSSVLNFNQQAQALMQSEPAIIAARTHFGLDILPGDNSAFFADTLVPYEKVPKLERDDYLQNANDSYWVTNPEALLTGYPPTYGTVPAPLSMRSRMSLKMIEDSGGEDGKFNLDELESVLMSDRLYLAELIKDDLVNQCQAQGDSPVLLGSTPVNIEPTCQALANWDGTAALDSQSGHIFREFANYFYQGDYLSVEFDVTNPANTPNTLTQHDDLMALLALVTVNLSQAGFSVDASLAEMQFVEKTLPGNVPGPRLPWAGGSYEEGGFNVFSSYNDNNHTLMPQHGYDSVLDVITNQPVDSDLTTQGYHRGRGSSWMFVVNFDENGPKAKGLSISSQSSHSTSEFFSDQTLLYSDSVSLRPILFTQADIDANVLESLDLRGE